MRVMQRKENQRTVRRNDRDLLERIQEIEVGPERGRRPDVHDLEVRRGGQVTGLIRDIEKTLHPPGNGREGGHVQDHLRGDLLT